jgi:hypothetical protein
MEKRKNILSRYFKVGAFWRNDICLFLFRAGPPSLSRLFYFQLYLVVQIAFWDIAPYSLVEVDRSFNALMLEAVRTSRKRRSTTTRLYGAVSQKSLIFILAAVRTCNFTNLVVIIVQISV